MYIYCGRERAQQQLVGHVDFQSGICLISCKPQSFRKAGVREEASFWLRNECVSPACGTVHGTRLGIHSDACVPSDAASFCCAAHSARTRWPRMMIEVVGSGTFSGGIAC